MGALLSAPASPPLTEKNIPNQSGKVFLITGSTNGVGYELAKILYGANARVWLVARSKAKGQSCLDSIRASHPTSKGQLDLLLLDLNDLSTIRPAVDVFLQRESRLDILWNNAGIMIPPKGTVTAQGLEAQIGVNAVAPHLLTKLLVPTLIKTAAQGSDAGRPRVVWVSSSAAKAFSPEGGVDLDALEGTDNQYSQWQKYGMSKAANILQAAEFARRYGEHGILSVAADPGNLDTGLYKDMPRYQHFIAKKLALKPAIYGAYTELFAGFSNEISAQNNGAWVIPWGAVSTPRKDLDVAKQPQAPGVKSTAERFWNWCDEQVKRYE